MPKIMEEARSRLSGAELKVHEAILESCTDLMDLIRQLIQASDILQTEIVEVGRVSALYYAKRIVCKFTCRVRVRRPNFTTEIRVGLKDS